VFFNKAWQDNNFIPSENVYYEEEFEDNKGVNRISKSKNRQHNGQMKKHKTKTKNDLQNIHIKQKIE